MADVDSLSHKDFDDFIKRDDLGAKMAFRAFFRRSLYAVSKVLVAWSEPRNLMAPASFKERQDWLQWVVCDHKRGLLEDPRGYIKCLPLDARVPLRDGRWLKAGDVQPGDELAHGGFVRRRWERASCKFVDVRAGAWTVRLGVDHPVSTQRGFVKARDLTTADFVRCPQRYDFDATGTLDVNEAALLGYVVGDGCVRGDSCNVTNGDLDIIANVVNVAHWCGFKTKVSGELRKKIVYLSGGARAFVRKHGLANKGSYTKTVPDAVWTASDAAVAAFIRAYFDCDGTAGGTQGQVSLSSCQRAILEDVGRLLLRFNLHTALYTIKEGTHYCLRIRDNEAFSRLIGFGCARKQAMIRAQGACADLVPAASWQSLPRGRGEQYLRNRGIRVNRAYATVTRQKLRWIALTAEHDMSWWLDAEWKRVESVIATGSGPAVDFETDTHELPVGPFITHNSSGCTRTVPIFCAIQHTDETRDHPNEIKRADEFLATRAHLRGVDSRLLILGDTETNAARFTASTLNIINTNPLLRWLFDELIWPNPNRRAYKCEYNGHEWTLNGRRNVTMADAFVRAAGAETAIVGGRADGEIFNDLIGEHNHKSATEIERQRSFVKTAPFLLENRDPMSPEGGFVIVEGNRWGLNDVNSLIHEEYPDYAIWRRGVFKCYVHGMGSCGRWGAAETKTCGPTIETIWPERHPDADAIARLERDINDPAAAAAQLHNDPTAAADLDPARMLPFYVEVRAVRDHRGKLTREWCAIVANAVDGVRGEEAIPLPTMDPHIVSVDPAASDEPGSARTAIVWYARDPVTGRRFVIDCVADRWAADSGRAESAIVDMIAQVAERARIAPATVKSVIEKVAAQGYLGSAVKHEAGKRRINVRPPILAKPVKGMAKIDRDRRLVGYPMSQNLLYVRDGLALPRTEARHFPTGTLDTLDAIAQAEVVLGGYRGMVQDDERAQARRAARERRLAASTVTGAPL